MVILCSGTGSVDAVFRDAGFKIISIDWDTDSAMMGDPAFILLNIKQWKPEVLHFRVFIKTSKINDKTRDPGHSR